MQCNQCQRDWPDEFRLCPLCGAALAGDVAHAEGGSMATVGDYNISVLHGNVYVGAEPRDPAEARRIYQQVLVATIRHLPLRGVDVGASDPTGGQKPLDLAQVYVDLDTKTAVPVSKEEPKKRQREPALPGERETRPLGALEAVAGHRQLVLLGDPGSGKSTFVSYLALSLAAHALDPQAGWLDRLPGWPAAEADAVPILVTLRDFARGLPAGACRAEPSHLWGFICDRLAAQNLAFAAALLHDALEHGRAVVLLDGLDEVPGEAGRAFVRDAVAVFARRYPRCRLVVTCRTLSYQDPAWRLSGVPSFELAPFDQERIDRFIAAWYAELARLNVVRSADAAGQTSQLRQAVRRPDLWRLAANPLLLTVMALVHTHKGRLPDARALLYEETVDILLWRWEQLKAGRPEEAPRLRQLLLDAGRTDVDLKKTLWRLAFEAHQAGGAGADTERVADVGELRLVKALAELHPQGSLDWARQVVEQMKQRAGLLVERVPEVFTFPHRTFQEYLAGAHLSAQADFARQAARLVAEGALWREVILLAVGRLVYLGGDTDKPLALVGELCPATAADDDLAWRRAWLAGEVLVEVGLNRVQDSALGRDLLARVRDRLADLVAEGRLTPVERAAAGRALGNLGDPRPGVGLREDGLPDLVWCPVPAGPFLMGSDKKRDREAYHWETPQHRFTIAQDCYIARCPMTNAQFAAFVDAADGYRNDRWWTKAGLAWRGDREGPEKYGGVFDLPNHPVAGVTWYEAVAFCRWLTERLRSVDFGMWIWRDGQLEIRNPQSAIGNRVVRLPSEAEWEKAARGVEGRLWPWGNEFDAAKCNMADTGIGTTSAVGIFLGGASPYGALDMAGNVWEWCATKWQGSYQDYWDDSDLAGAAARVVRGGSFGDLREVVRCAARPGNDPYGRVGSLGFRVVLASPVGSLASGPSGL